MLTTLTAGSGLPLALGAATLINLRFLPTGISVANSFAGPTWKRALGAQTILDGSRAAAYQGAGRYDRLTMFGASAVQWTAWILGTPVGVAVLLWALSALVVLVVHSLAPSLLANLLIAQLLGQGWYAFDWKLLRAWR